MVLIEETRRFGLNDSQLFLNFINNCQHAEVISDDSISGILVCLYGCDPIHTPYKYIRIYNNFIPVTSCIIKLNIIASKLDKITYLHNLYTDNCISEQLNFERRDPVNDSKNGNIEIQTVKSFKDEVNNTQYIFRKSFQSSRNDGLYLEPICPSIITYNNNLHTYDLIVGFIQLLVDKCDEPSDKQLLERFLLLITNLNRTKVPTKCNYDYKLGFMCMEMMEYFKILSSLRDSRYFDDYKDYALYQLLKLGLNFNFIHRDAHFKNIMICKKIPFPEVGKFGYPIIIDFGRVQLLSPAIYNYLRRSISRIIPLGVSMTKFSELLDYYSIKFGYPESFDKNDYDYIKEKHKILNLQYLSKIALDFGTNIDTLKQEINSITVLRENELEFDVEAATSIEPDVERPAIGGKLAYLQDKQENLLNNTDSFPLQKQEIIKFSDGKNNLTYEITPNQTQKQADNPKLNEFIKKLKEYVTYQPFEFDISVLNKKDQKGSSKYRKNKTKSLKKSLKKTTKRKNLKKNK